MINWANAILTGESVFEWINCGLLKGAWNVSKASERIYGFWLFLNNSTLLKVIMMCHELFELLVLNITFKGGSKWVEIKTILRFISKTEIDWNFNTETHLNWVDLKKWCFILAFWLADISNMRNLLASNLGAPFEYKEEILENWNIQTNN